MGKHVISRSRITNRDNLELTGEKSWFDNPISNIRDLYFSIQAYQIDLISEITDPNTGFGVDSPIIYVNETKTFYTYIVSAPLLIVDNKFILDTVDGGDTRYVGVAGLYGTIHNSSAGLNEEPALNDNLDGTVDVSACCVTIYDNATFEGNPRRYTLAGDTFLLTNGVTNYIIADYNSGDPILKVVTNVEVITESDIVPIYTIYRGGIYLHDITWGKLGQGLANKIHASIVKTQRYRREFGLILTEHGTRNLNVSAGRVFVGSIKVDLDAIDTTVLTEEIFFYKHVAGVWTLSRPTQYNNTEYDDGNNLVTLTANRYAVCWMYRGIEDKKHLYMILGTGDYTLSQASLAQAPVPPQAISSHAMLISKIIVQKGSNIAISIESAFDIEFGYATVVSHHDLIDSASGDDHPQYTLIAGRVGEDLTVQGALITDTINELGAGAGVIIDGVELKDGGGTFINAIIQSVISTTHASIFQGVDTKKNYAIGTGSSLWYDTDTNWGIRNLTDSKTLLTVTPTGIVNMSEQSFVEAYNLSQAMTANVTDLPLTVVKDTQGSLK